jgi:hypothetical protein
MSSGPTGRISATLRDPAVAMGPSNGLLTNNAPAGRYARSLYPRTKSRWLIANSTAVAAVRNASDSPVLVSE